MIVKNLVILAFLSLLLELLLPKGTTKKYAKFVMGLLVLIVMINPVLQVIDEDIPVVEYFKDDSVTADTEDIIVNGQNVRSNISETVIAEYKDDIAKQIEDMLLTVDGIQDVTTEIGFDGDEVDFVTLALSVEPEFQEDPEKIQNIREEAEKVLNDFYGIQGENIRISIVQSSD